jgi:hypothetical protein
MAYSGEGPALAKFQDRTNASKPIGFTRKCACCKKDTHIKPGYRNKPVYVCAECNLKGRGKLLPLVEGD